MEVRHPKNSRVVFPVSKKVHIGKSRIHGMGVIAKRPIKKHETAFTIKGKVVRWKVKDQKTSLAGAHWVGHREGTWIDAIGFAKFLNHSSKPNCGIRGTRTVAAMRDIKKGEEITIDYATTEGDLLWYMKDMKTKKRVRSIQHLPPAQFKKYLPLIPAYFQKVYRDYHHM